MLTVAERHGVAMMLAHAVPNDVLRDWSRQATERAFQLARQLRMVIVALNAAPTTTTSSASRASPARIITMHGAKKFAGLLKELGLNAEHLAQHPSQQKSTKGRTRRAAAGIERKLFE